MILALIYAISDFADKRKRIVNPKKGLCRLLSACRAFCEAPLLSL